MTPAHDADGLVVLSGCSGGGKSTLLAELARRGFTTVPEPGRRVVEEQRAVGGSALPWVDLAAFARRALAMALMDRAGAMTHPKPVFFDRSAIDAASALEHFTGEPALGPFKDAIRYDPRLFLVPPWPEIYATDGGRRHGLTEAIAEYDRLRAIYADLGYEVALVPKLPVGARADWILSRLGSWVKVSG